MSAFDERRFGRLYINRKHWHDPAHARLILERVVPLRVELLGYADEYEIDGYSQDFEPLEEGMMIREYRALFRLEDDERAVFEGFEA